MIKNTRALRSAALRVLLPAPGAGREGEGHFLRGTFSHLGFANRGAGDVRSRRGTGLGLYVARALVRSIGGRLRAESAGIGHGTTMRIELT